MQVSAVSIFMFSKCSKRSKKIHLHCTVLPSLSIKKKKVDVTTNTLSEVQRILVSSIALWNVLRVMSTPDCGSKELKWLWSPFRVLSFLCQPNLVQMEAVLSLVRYLMRLMRWGITSLQNTFVAHSLSSCSCSKFRFLAQFDPLLSKLVPSDTFYRVILPFPTALPC